MKYRVAAALYMLVPVFCFAQDGRFGVSTVSLAAPASAVVMEEMMVSSDPGIRIYVRNKHRATQRSFTPQTTVLFVHGATYPAETSFDLPVNGLSWMDYIAQHGYDVYLMDVRGYGRSTRPPQMDEPPDQNPPIADTEAAVRDISAVVDHILARRGLKRMDLIGWSWGTSTMASYTAANTDKVERLVLYAPLWLRQQNAAVPIATGGPVGAYRTVTRKSAYNRWMNGVPEDKQADLIPAGAFDQWWNATLATDPVGSQQSPPVLRAPDGVLHDGEKFWSAGKPTYDPARITVPVLLIQAEWDHDTPPYMSHTLFSLLVNAPEKRYVMIGEGTHTVMLEKNRMELFREVQVFLDEATTQPGERVAAN